VECGISDQRNNTDREDSNKDHPGEFSSALRHCLNFIVKAHYPRLSAETGRRYDGLAMAETLRCPSCGTETEPDARKCGKCRYSLMSELECQRSIERSVGIIKRILIWWLVVSFLGAVLYLISRMR
jgi:hypothetical protein